MSGDTVTYTSSYPLGSRFKLTSDLGLMKYLSNEYAIGVSHYFSVALDGEEEVRSGLKLRASKWLGQATRIDLSTGLILWETSDLFETPGFVGTIDFRAEEWFLITGTFEYLRGVRYEYAYSSTDRTIYEVEDDVQFHVGVKVGAVPGLIAHGVGIVVVGVLAVIFATAYSSD